MLFADGENLLLRYEAMLANGAPVQVRNTIHHEQGRFVWCDTLTAVGNLEFTRVAYYTTFVGDDIGLQQLRTDIQKLTWNPNKRSSVRRRYVHPRVFKKPSKEQKVASVDINITIDVLRHCYHKDVEAIYVLTGDGDYLPLIEEAMKTGTRVFVGAFSEGLNPRLNLAGDQFFNLDHWFFQ
jgi:uncharacterized LabA/DUF88 family protein